MQSPIHDGYNTPLAKRPTGDDNRSAPPMVMRLKIFGVYSHFPEDFHEDVHIYF
jgi:hypothetical protein